MKETLISISHFAHLIASVVWIGGLAVFSLFVWPEAKRTLKNPDESHELVLRLYSRFRPAANVSLVVLLGTGMLQLGADDNYKGFLTFTNTWTIAMLLKHIAFGGMVILTAMLQFGVVPALERETLLAARGQPHHLEALLQRQTRLIRWLLWLGVVVLIFTAVATAL
jgi:uncharacterized membrane protein